MKVEERAFELNLLPLETERKSPARLAGLAVGSLAVHVVLFLIAISLPAIDYKPIPPINVVEIRKSVTIVAPRFSEPTQKDPNIGKVSRELDVRSAVQGAKPQAPKFRPPSFQPPSITPGPVTPAPSIEKHLRSRWRRPTLCRWFPTRFRRRRRPRNRRIQVRECRRPGSNPASKINISIPRPEVSAQAAARKPVRSSTTGGLTVGDIGDDISVAGIAPSSGAARSNLQLLSDAQGVDFKPYLVQVLTAVRRNWLAVIPESARLGRRGRVAIQFIIDRKGGVPKLVIASPSGTEALDRAAVVGVSMSNPFPPLPAGYKGDEVRLELSFSYNGSR